MKKDTIITYILLMIFILLCFVVFNSYSNLNTIKTLNTKVNKKSMQTNMETPQVTASPKSENVATGGKYTIGWTVYNASFEYFKSMQEGVLAKAKELGINVITHDQKSDELEMIMGVRDLISKGIDALIISPVNPEVMVVVNELAKKEGIPVIVVDIGSGGADVEALIISDNFGGGILAGEYALRLISEHSVESKNVAILKVEETAIYARRRGEGFKRVLEERGYNVVAEVTIDDGESSAYDATKEILSKYEDDIAVIFCETDRMALGAARAVDEAGKKGKILVIGFDGDPAAIEAIKEGLMQGTIAQQPYEMGELGVELANTVLNGGTIVYDDFLKKELYMEVFLIDEKGNSKK